MRYFPQAMHVHVCEEHMAWSVTQRIILFPSLPSLSSLLHLRVHSVQIYFRREEGGWEAKAA